MNNIKTVENILCSPAGCLILLLTFVHEENMSSELEMGEVIISDAVQRITYIISQLSPNRYNLESYLNAKQGASTQLSSKGPNSNHSRTFTKGNRPILPATVQNFPKVAQPLHEHSLMLQ